MHTFMRIRRTWGAALLGVLALLFVFGSGAAQAVTFDLTAKAGSTLLPGAPGPVSVWGYVDTLTNPAVAQPGGPVLIVNEGDSVTVNLTNTLTVATGMLFQGQAMVPDTTGAPAGGGTKTYTFTATNPGTFLYEAGLLPNAQHQAAMGLYGALVVRPAVAGQAYADAGTAFNDEAVLVVSEIDPGLNNSATPAAFDMRNYAPRYFLINGKAYPDTDAITGNAGNKLLLRYVNAGIQHHSMGVLGLRQIFVAKDGSVLPMLNHNVVAETLAPGQTGDAIATVPLATPNGSRFAVHDGSMMLHNNGASNAFGGMLTFINVGVATPENTGPATSNVMLSPNQTTMNVSVALSATVSDVGHGGENVAAAEYFIDAAGAPGSGTSMTLTPAGSPTVTASTTISAATIAALSDGNHNVYVRGQDDHVPAAWGAVAVAVLKVDRVGPATTLLTLTPNSSNGTVAVGMTASANDAASGGSSIAAAEYFIDTTGAAGSGTSMSVTPTGASTASLSATIPAATINALANGDHNVTVRSKDALGNWGALSTAVLHVVKTGPTTTGVSANPNPNNGTKPLSLGQPVVRITATMTSAGSTVSAAEAFIDAVGATGTGFPLLPSDGVFNAATETGFVDVPLTTINNLSTGNHTLYVRGRDATGNWGTAASTVLLIDKMAPTFTGIALAPNPTFGATSVTMTVNGANDPLVSGLASGVVGGEYWIDTAAPAPGGGTAFTGLAPTISVSALATGNHTIGARVRDGAGNWSAGTSSATVFVVPDAIFSNGFETAGAPWGWTSRSTTNTTALNRTAASALVGSFGLRAQGNGANYVQSNFGTAANPATATYDARFYFNPNGNTGNNQDILVARTTGSTTVFRVRYRWNGGSPQVQIQVGTGNANGAWTGITNGASNRIEVVWQSGGTLQLFVGASAVAAQSLTATTTSVGQVRLGSVTSGGNNVAEYFDAFSSKRTVTPYGP